MEKPKLKDSYSIEDLLHIMELLRGENGCPWDRVQTHDSIKIGLIEEAYESIDALEKGNDELFANELGDVLLQVVFHSQIAKERGAFNFNKVLYELCTKLITRHTHVFGDDSATNADDALSNWEKNKNKEYGAASQKTVLNEIPKHLPALMRAGKVLKKSYSFDVQKLNSNQLLDVIDSLCIKLFDENNLINKEAYQKLLFAVVALGKENGLDSETELSTITNKYIENFESTNANNDFLTLFFGRNE